MRDFLEILTASRDFTRSQAREVFARIMAGDVPAPVMAALLAALRTKRESVEELVGAAEAMRNAAVRIQAPPDCLDTCGTGGDGISTFNVSTAAALVAAAAGAVVAKHGNRSTTRASGSSDVLEHLGIDIETSPAAVERCLAQIGIGYLNARQLHPAMKHAAPVRQALQVRTIFNLLGPLTNPAGARRQVLGVPHPDLLSLIAQALQQLGAEHVWVVHGHDGLCDLTITGETSVVELQGGELRRFVVTPESVGLPRASLDALRVDSPAASARVISEVLAGAAGPTRDHTLLNAGAALVVAGKAGDLGDGVRQAAIAVDTGKAQQLLTRWRKLVPHCQSEGTA